MKKILFVCTICALALLSCKNEQAPVTQGQDIETHPSKANADYNVRRANELVEQIFPLVAFIEGNTGEGKPYFCGVRYTVLYGVTVKPDGTLIKKNDKRISKATGKEWCIYHIKNRLNPFFQYFDGRKLSDEQIIGTALFMYNLGGENITGYDENGNKVGEPSWFLNAVNSGKNDDYCVNCMTRYRQAGGKRANGLLKRHWVQGAVYKGILTAENVMCLKPCQFYVTKNMGNYYWLDRKRNIIEKDGLLQLRYDDTTINTFFNMNQAYNGKSVEDII